MALHPDFPDSPHAILDPAIRWFPADETLRHTIMPPLVATLRVKVKEFRNGGYVRASATSKSLLNWWFNIPHLLPQVDGNMAEFQYFFSQREALETIVYLYDAVGAKDKFDLMRFDSSGAVSASMFDETWRRYVVKMATGTGKTKVLSLALAWSYFHKRYEPNSELARNFLLIAPNIIVLDRIYKDFQGLKLFFEDPIIPYNGFDGQNWQDDFQLKLHLQDEVRVTQPTGNIFLTNIHRVYAGKDIPPTPEDDDTEDFFLGKRPTGKTTDSKVDLGMIVRDIDELMVLNDEAHHIHDERLAWFKSIKDIHNRLVQKGSGLALQIDVTATPRHNNGAIFVQTIADYPLVEAISQNVVKHPLLPDADSRSKLAERQSGEYTEQYADYLHLGVIEWRKTYDEHQKMGKKAILFIMTNDTRNCDNVANYLERTYSDLKNAVLVIHTKRNGEISEASSGRKNEELETLRKQANEIDDPTSPYKAVVSVLMLKEGWDVRNVTTIVGLRPYNARSNILLEQTLGRGLRKMYTGGEEEYLSVVGTNAFMDFIEDINKEGVELEHKPMGLGTAPKTPIVIEIDKDNPNKDLDTLDIGIPVLTPRIYREYKNLTDLDVSAFGHNPVTYQSFSEEEQREIVFKDITTGEITHTTVLDSAGIADYRSVVGYFAKAIKDDLRLVSGYDVLYKKVKIFMQNYLFDQSITLESANTIRNLSELAATKTLLESFKTAINELTVEDRGAAEIKDTIRLRETRPFVVKKQDYIFPNKSIFNRIIGDSHLELDFAKFLENCTDIQSYAKNYLAVYFKIDYVDTNGNISNYHPDFIVKLKDGRIFVVETKGLEDCDVRLKMKRLQQWCEDANTAQTTMIFDFVYIDERDFQRYTPSSFAQVIENFREYK